MAEKILNTRILMKIDTLENWGTSTLKLKEGELAFATVAASAGTGLTEPVVMVKIGTAEEKTFSELPWAFHAKASDVLAACKSEASLKAFIKNVLTAEGVASDSVLQELAGRVTTAEGEIDTLQSEMDAVEKKAADNEAAIGELDTLVGDKAVATQISEAIAALDLANTYAAKAHGHVIADVEGLSDSIAAAKKAGTDANAALEAYKTTNDAAVKVNSDAIAGIKNGETLDSFKEVEEALAGKQAAGNYSVVGHKHEIADVNGLSDAIAGAQKAGTDAAAQALTDAKAYTDTREVAIKAAYEAYADQAEADALAAAKSYTDGLVGDKSVSEQIAELDLANTYAAKVHTHVKADITDFDHTHAISEVTGLQDALDGKQAAGDYATKTEAQGYADAKDAAIAAAKKAGDDAQADVDALELYVGTIPETAEATNIVAYVQEKTAGIATDTALEELTGRVATAEGAIDAIEADYLKAADKEELQGAIDDLEELVGGESVATQISTAVAAEAEIARAAEKANADAIDAIEKDYLKAADKTELQGNIDTVSAAVERLTNGVSAEEVDGVNDLIQYVKDHGTEVTGMKADIKANADAIDAIEADYLKTADKTALQDQITANDGEIAALQTAVGTKAAQSDLEALAGRVTTAEGKVSTLEGEMDTAQADIEALEGYVGGKNVSTQISEAIEALKIGDYAKAADLTAAVARIAQNESDIDALEGRMDTAESDIEALETEVAKKANDADLAAIAKTGNVNDLVQTEGDVLIFDCGNASA